MYWGAWDQFDSGHKTDGIYLLTVLKNLYYAIKSLCLHCIIILDMNFVDRIEEIARLRDALSKERSSLVVVYGRRRLGKSTLKKGIVRQ